MCLDEGTIQAFLDGELDAQFMEAAAEHIADCGACAFALSYAEEESVTAFSALEREFDTLVPTHRLWTKINTSIEDEKRGKSVWQIFTTGISGFGFNFTTITAFASLFIVGGIFAAAWMSKQTIPNIDAPTVNNEVAVVNPILPNVSDVKNPTPESDESTFEEKFPVVNRKATAKEEFKSSKAIYEMPSANPKNSRPEIISPELPKTVVPEALPGEETYIKTIASLEKSVDRQKDLTLKPSARITYEKDMAVLDDAIKNLQTEVKKNPKNDGAKKLLLASYQNKIDLLNSVSNKNDLMVSLK